MNNSKISLKNHLLRQPVQPRIKCPLSKSQIKNNIQKVLA